ncbi:hypothetical protein ABTZ78_30985 [Streptomyces bauhiniae]|uniref:hypothetical protein n=1 Tax=Streptomyces TaxID=1883 RepID=UPI001C2D3EDD|nr:hypothetical protein [Streptomyces sp. NK08203]
MSGEQGRGAWVGDLVHDEDADRRGIVTDVRGGTLWVLRPEYGTGQWTSESPERLTLLEARQH